jgi:hypothetical protein
MYTLGSPSPSVQKAMLTPSAVCVYWMRGSIATIFYTNGKSFSTGRFSPPYRQSPNLM